ncbi:MAG: ribosomal protein S18-alanine N-acetyltransferase [bacterium]|nr:ribosomal protein S18-alanine N-acetyltransferase [bacterium]
MLETQCNPVPWSKSQLEKEIENKDSILLGTFSDSKLIAYLIFRLGFNEAEVLQIGVDLNFRKKGIAKNLLKEGIKRLPKSIEVLNLEVRKSNSQAILFYNKIDFKQVGERKGYYQESNEDAVLMSKILL